MKKRRNFLMTENSYGDIVNINNIVYIAKRDSGSKIYTLDNKTCIVKETPECVLDTIVGKRKKA